MSAGVDESELDRLAGSLDEAMARLPELDPVARQTTTGVLDSLNGLHKAGLTTIVRRLKEDPRGKELLFELVDDPGVRMLLMMHGIIRPDPMTVARQVLDRVRPGLQSHGGDVELVSVAGGIAQVRLQGACNGCSMAAVTMREGVEAALVAGVPGVTAVEVLAADPTATLIPLSSIGVGPPAGDDSPSADDAGLVEAGWVRALAAERVPVGTLQAVTLDPGDGRGVEAIVVNAAGQLAAYVNECAHQGLPLDNAMVDAVQGTLTCPWHGFCYDSTTGECMTMPGAQLEQLPLRLEAGFVWVRSGG